MIVPNISTIHPTFDISFAAQPESLLLIVSSKGMKAVLGSLESDSGKPRYLNGKELSLHPSNLASSLI